MRIAGVVLAGGQGQRLGGADKGLLCLGGASLMSLAIARMQPQVEMLAISAQGAGARFGTKLPVLPDLDGLAALGPLSGILAAMTWAGAAGADYLATCAVDTPHFPCDLVARLRLALDLQAGARVALARGERVHSTFGLWPAALRDDLAMFLNSGRKPKVQDFAAAQGLALADFADDRAFDNINTAADLARLAAMAG